MHVDITIKDGDKTFTIRYDGVVRVLFQSQAPYNSYPNTIEITLEDCYTAKCIKNYWCEYHKTPFPFIHDYDANIVESISISEK